MKQPQYIMRLHPTSQNHTLNTGHKLPSQTKHVKRHFTHTHTHTHTYIYIYMYKHVTLCSLVTNYEHFGGIGYRHIQGKQQVLPTHQQRATTLQGITYQETEIFILLI
jgi:hypothetical protein